jgi:glycosyltransferase involved in cell wall biosynthesis
VLTGESILCFAPDPWNDIWRNRHQIMSLLAESNRVLYVEPRPYLREVLKRPLKSASRPRLRRVGQGDLAPGTGLFVYRPPRYAPISGRAPLSSVTGWLREDSLRQTLRRLQMRAPILWLYRPDMADLPGRCGEHLVIYHIVDEYVGYAALDAERAERVRQRERSLIARADLVLVTSQALLASKGGINPNTHWVPNAVDYARFAQAAQVRALPAELAGRPRPWIGYVGAINDKIDLSLLEQVAERWPQATLVLVGPERVQEPDNRAAAARLHARPNVCFVGQVGVERVPEFVAACDVGLLPYRLNDWTRNIHPLKLYEYLACGLPVVSTDIPAVHEQTDVVQIAADAAHFVSAIAVALSNAEELAAERQARAAANTWRQRVEQISELIERTRSS